MAQNENNNQGASLHLDGDTAFCQGDWTAPYLDAIERASASLRWPRGSCVFDLSGIRRLDTAGAWMLHQLQRQVMQAGCTVDIINASEKSQSLLALTDRAPAPRPEKSARQGLLEDVGRIAVRLGREGMEFMAFVGELGMVAWNVMRHPARLRIALMLHNLEGAGFRALPIVGLLSFLLGVVIAYQGGVQLEKYGANLYIADLVGISMLRELAPLITAIIVAGRTGSAFTAQIGTMKVNDEIDALRTMGIPPSELLVLPKVLALMIALPLLTVYADIMALFGGLAIANLALGLSPTSFIERVGEAVSLHSYLIGIGKAPVFAAIIGTVGCFQGFQVAQTAESVGQHTTVSVVQSIFLVIVVDAIFSVLLSRVGF